MYEINLFPKKLLKASEVANRLSISRAMAYRLMQQGIIPTVHIENARRVRPDDLQQYIEANLKNSPLQK